MQSRIYIFVVLPFLFISCGHEQKPASTSLMEASRQELANAIEERDSLVILVKEISETMEQVKDLENIIALSSTASPDSLKNKPSLTSDLIALKNTLASRRNKLVRLEKELETSNIYSEKVKCAVKSLRKRIDTQYSSIEKMKSEISLQELTISSLNRKVDSLNSEIASAGEYHELSLAEAKREIDRLHTCYFIVAKKSELKKHNIIEERFLSSSKIMEGNFDHSFFVANDRRSLSRIDLNSRKGKILTNHPDGSYEIIDSTNNKILHITDPELFWSLTNYLVIQTD